MFCVLFEMAQTTDSKYRFWIILVLKSSRQFIQYDSAADTIILDGTIRTIP